MPHVIPKSESLLRLDASMTTGLSDTPGTYLNQLSSGLCISCLCSSFIKEALERYNMCIPTCPHELEVHGLDLRTLST